jgi:hypothetical protein
MTALAEADVRFIVVWGVAVAPAARDRARHRGVAIQS